MQLKRYEERRVRVRVRVRDRDRDTVMEGNSQMRRITPSIQACIETIAIGEKPVIDLDIHPDMRQLRLNFIQRCQSIQMEQCLSCKERWWDLKIGENQICARCEKEKKRKIGNFKLLTCLWIIKWTPFHMITTIIFLFSVEWNKP